MILNCHLKWLSENVLLQAVRGSLLLTCLWQEKDRWLHKNRQPSQCEGPHTSLLCQIGISTRPQSPCSTPVPHKFHWFSSRPAPATGLQLPALTLTHRQPPAFLAVSHALRAVLMLPRAEASSTMSVPTFQYDGRFVGGGRGGISCGLFMPKLNNYCSANTGCIRWKHSHLTFWLSCLSLEAKVATSGCVFSFYLCFICVWIKCSLFSSNWKCPFHCPLVWVWFASLNLVTW